MYADGCVGGKDISRSTVIIHINALAALRGVSGWTRQNWFKKRNTTRIHTGTCNNDFCSPITISVRLLYTRSCAVLSSEVGTFPGTRTRRYTCTLLCVKQITIQFTTWPEGVHKGGNWRSGKYPGSNALEMQQHKSDTPRRATRTKINRLRPTPVHTYRHLASRKNNPEIGSGWWWRRGYNWTSDFFNEAPF